jgi:hypothetical protein
MTFAFADDVARRDAEDPRRSRLDVNGDRQLDLDDGRSFRAMAHSFAVIAEGCSVGVSGAVLLTNALRSPPDRAQEVRSLPRRRGELRRSLECGAAPVAGGFALSLKTPFLNATFPRARALPLEWKSALVCCRQQGRSGLCLADAVRGRRGGEPDVTRCLSPTSKSCRGRANSLGAERAAALHRE